MVFRHAEGPVPMEPGSILFLQNEPPQTVLIFLAGVTNAHPLAGCDVTHKTVISDPQAFTGNCAEPVDLSGDAQFLGQPAFKSGCYSCFWKITYNYCNNGK